MTDAAAAPHPPRKPATAHDALLWLAREYGIDLPEVSKRSQRRHPRAAYKRDGHVYLPRVEATTR